MDENSRTMYPCGKAPPLQVVYGGSSSMFDPFGLNSPNSSELKCGSDNSEIAGGGAPDEAHLAICALTTLEKLSAYSDKGVHRKVQWVYDWAKENTDCEIDQTDSDFWFIAKPSKESVLMNLHKACLAYESSKSKTINAPLVPFLRAFVKSEIAKEIAKKEDIQSHQDRYVEIIFGMVLGYSAKATFDYMTTTRHMPRLEFKELHKSARARVLALLRNGLQMGELRNDIIEAFLQRSSM